VYKTVAQKMYNIKLVNCILQLELV